MKTLITAYETPDLDGVASAYAYNELKNKLGEEMVWGVFGKPHLEVDFVFSHLSLTISQAEPIVGQVDNIILVDCSDTRGVSKSVDIKKVIELIDHRAVNEADKFINASSQIELVGACATLIVEKFIAGKIDPSKEAATMLLLAIVSNTINFKAKVTTERDKAAASFLKRHCQVDEQLIHEMFDYKSNFSQPMIEILSDKLYFEKFAEKTLSIFQLELLNAQEFVDQNHYDLAQAMTQIMDEQDYDLAFLTCIDLEKGINIFLVVDEASEELLEAVLKIRFYKNTAVLPHIMMRKELIPLIKKFLEK